MSGADGRRRQKKLEKSKKKRAAIRKDARRQALDLTGASLLQKARAGAFGPTWIASAIDEEAQALPSLITVIVTRRVAGLFLPHMVLVDRTCLGIKNATLLERMAEMDLRDFVASIGNSAGPFRECEPLFAQSVVFHALEYAKGLGFEPHRDFRSALVEPRPETLLDTPLGTPERPIYVSGPRDDVQRITAHLDARVGPSGYTFLLGSSGFGGAFEEDDLDFDADDENEFDEEAESTVQAEGTPVTGWTERR